MRVGGGRVVAYPCTGSGGGYLKYGSWRGLLEGRVNGDGDGGPVRKPCNVNDYTDNIAVGG